jgi:hypothetical protein
MADVNGSESRLTRASSVALLIASIYSAALIVAGFVVPMYSSLSASSSPADSSGSVSSPVVVSHGSATLVAVNGLGGALVLSIPLLVSLAVGVALWQSARRGAVPIAWTLTWLMVAFNLAGMMTIGMFIIPVTVALLFACSRIQPRPKQHKVTTHPAAIG